MRREVVCLATEAVEGASLPLEGIDDIHGSHGLATRVLGVRYSIPNNVLKEDLEHSTGLFIDQAGDTLHTTTTSQTPDSRLGNALDIVTKNLPVTLCTALSETLAALATTRHD
jgi:hypothetical protein